MGFSRFAFALAIATPPSFTYTPGSTQRSEKWVSPPRVTPATFASPWTGPGPTSAAPYQPISGRYLSTRSWSFPWWRFDFLYSMAIEVFFHRLE